MFLFWCFVLAILQYIKGQKYNNNKFKFSFVSSTTFEWLKVDANFSICIYLSCQCSLKYLPDLFVIEFAWLVCPTRREESDRRPPRDVGAKGF